MAITPDPAEGGAQLLSRFGVSSEAESVWRILITEPDLERDDLSRRTALGSADLDRAIDELVEASLVRSGPTPTGVVTIEPKLALESHLAAAERQMAEQAEAFTALRMLIPKLSSERRRSRGHATELPDFEVISNLADIRRQIDLAASQVASEIRALDHSPAVIPDGSNVQAQHDVLARGVHDRAIVAPDALSRPGVFEEFLDLQQRGHDARVHPAVTTRVILYDRDLAVLPVDPDNMPLGAIFIRTRSVIDALALMYDEMWKVATPIFTTTDDSGPVGRHARILELLAIGNKDEAIARALHIGVRTIRRDVAELKEILGVSSRAEIVAAAVRKGWL